MKEYMVIFRDSNPPRFIDAESAEHAMSMIPDDEKPWVNSIVPSNHNEQ